MWKDTIIILKDRIKDIKSRKYIETIKVDKQSKVTDPTIDVNIK